MVNGHAQGAEQIAGNGFVMGLVAGAVLGTGFGLLLAPRAGSELREQIVGSATRVGKAVAETCRQAGDLMGDVCV